MKHKIKILSWAVVGALAFSACDNETEPVATKGVHTYMAGYTVGTNGKQRVIMKDTMATISPEVSNIEVLAVSGTDIYAVGISNEEKWVVWKNNVATDFAVGETIYSITDMVVHGNDVYVVGNRRNASGNSEGALWTNGVATAIPGGEPYDIEIVENDIYIAGAYQAVVGGFPQAAYWKNGVRTVLTDSGTHPDAGSCVDCLSGSIAYGIAVVKSDVYVMGAPFGSGGVVLWKNNVAQWLGSSEAYFWERCIAASEGNVFYAYSDENTTGDFEAKYVANGVTTTLGVEDVKAVRALNGSAYLFSWTTIGAVKGRDPVNSNVTVTVYKNGEQEFTLTRPYRFSGVALGEK